MPVRFRNVHYYRIGRRYTFAGDLFVVRGALYFFPEVDLARQRGQTHTLPFQLAMAMWVIVYLIQKVNPYVSRAGLWEAAMTDEQFLERADARIEMLKRERGHEHFAETLPLPVRVSAGEISDIELSLMGRLSFTAQSDSHDFNIGLRRRRRLRDALWKCGLG